MRPAHVVCWFLVLAGLVLAADATRAADVRLLPSDTEMVLILDVKQLLNSELAKSQHKLIVQIKDAVASKLSGDSDAIKFLQKFGIDPLKDVHRFTFVHPGSKDKEDGLIVVEGTFDPDKFASTFKELANLPPNEIRFLKSGGTTIYETSGKPRPAYVALHQGTTLLMGHEKARLTDVLEQLSGTRKPALKPEVKDLLDTVSDKQTLSWVATSRAMFNIVDIAKIPKGLLNPQQDFNGTSLAITVAKDIQFQCTLGVDKKATADRIVEGASGALKFVRAMLAAQAQKDPKVGPIVDVIDTMRFKTMGTNVLMRGEVSYANLEKLIKESPKLGGN